MREATELTTLLEQIDGRGYKAYNQIVGNWRFADFVLRIDYVQGDPFAEPSRVRALVAADVAALPSGAFVSPARALGTASLLASSFSKVARRASSSAGSGRSGEIQMADPGQKVLLQTAVLIDDHGAVEARFKVGLPAQGRRVSGRQAIRLLTEAVPTLVRSTLLAAAHEPDQMEAHAASNEDADALRSQLRGLGLVAFVADGAVLPRESGIDDTPLSGEGIVPFDAPPSLRVEVDLPNAGSITGMGIPVGVTLVVGGGFHGKSTLLRALEAGVYNHKPGDGRERVVSRWDTVKVRTEDGRSIAGVDISSYIDNLPFGKTTKAFSTQNASGSTSQAATIVEACEAGAGVLLVDEDTSATNFMIRDRRMQELVPKAGEPITPFVDRVRSLYEVDDTSCVLVMGGSGDYIEVADTILRMHDYLPEDVSSEARAVAEAHPTGRRAEGGPPQADPAPRTIQPGSVDPRRGRRASYVRVPDGRTLLFGTERIDLAAVDQLVSRAQMRAVGHALAYIGEHLLGAGTTVANVLDRLDDVIRREGLDALDTRQVGDLAAYRRFELAAALNRLRTLRVE